LLTPKHIPLMRRKCVGVKLVPKTLKCIFNCGNLKSSGISQCWDKVWKNKPCPNWAFFRLLEISSTIDIKNRLAISPCSSILLLELPIIEYRIKEVLVIPPKSRLCEFMLNSRLVCDLICSKCTNSFLILICPFSHVCEFNLKNLS